MISESLDTTGLAGQPVGRARAFDAKLRRYEVERRPFQPPKEPNRPGVSEPAGSTRAGFAYATKRLFSLCSGHGAKPVPRVISDDEGPVLRLMPETASGWRGACGRIISQVNGENCTQLGSGRTRMGRRARRPRRSTSMSQLDAPCSERKIRSASCVDRTGRSLTLMMKSPGRIRL